MGFFNRIFAGKELKAALGVIDELELNFSKQSIGWNGFDIIKQELKAYLYENERELAEFNSKGQTPKVCVLFAIAKIAKNQLATGNYHIYRGVLNNLTQGPSLLSIHNKAVDLLVKEGKLTEEDSVYSKSQLYVMIKEIG